MKSIVGVDLFSGAGGMSFGFEQAGVRIELSVDSDARAVDAHQANFPLTKSLMADVSSVSGEDLIAEGQVKEEIDVLFGGPPCQGFSYGGRHDADDPRNDLLIHFARLVKELQPRFFVVENVPGLLRGKGKLLGPFLERIESAGFVVVQPIRILDARDFGVPQRRRRVFILGARRGQTLPVYPSPRRSSVTVTEAFCGLPVIDDFDYLKEHDRYNGPLQVPCNSYAAELARKPKLPERERYGLGGCSRTIHRKDTVGRFSRVAAGGFEPRSRFFRLDPNGVAPTLRAGTGPDKGSFTAPRPIHPNHARCITVREAARLQSLPDWFELHPTIWHGYRLVGNSVPPRLARAIAKQVVTAAQKSTGSAPRQRRRGD